MATKNLYECDSVGAMLLHSLLVSKQPGTARKAAKELAMSEEHTYLSDVLTLAWLLSPPELPTECAACAAFVEGDLDALLEALAAPAVAAPTPAASLPPLPPLPFARVFPDLPTDSSAAALRRAVSLAVGRGDAWRAAFLVTGAYVNNGDVAGAAALLGSFGAPPKLVDLLQTVTYAPLCSRVLEHGFAAVIRPPAMAPHAGGTIVGSSEKPGALRSARSLRIDGAALGTWGVASHPLARLCGFPRLVAEADASAYWVRVCSAAGATCPVDDGLGLAFPNDEACEAFYSTQFPDDIPDEWSAAEKSKSHGIAVSTPRCPWAAAFLVECTR
jgi:hypothetical protein